MAQLDHIIDNRAMDILKEKDYCLLGEITGIDRIQDGLVSVLPKVSKWLKDTTLYQFNDSIHEVMYSGISSGNSCITLPPKIGDTVLLSVCQHSVQPFKNNVEGQYEPESIGFLRLVDCISVGTLNSINNSDYNPLNFKNKINSQSLNIVHNKKQDNEIVLSLNQDGTVKLVSKQVDVHSPVVNCIDSTVNVDKDVVIQGQSVYEHMRQHRHRYTDDGTPMITEPPMEI